MGSQSGTWEEYGYHVLKEMERQNDNVCALNERMDNFEKECIKKMGKQDVVNALTNYKLYIIFAIISFAANGAWYYIYSKLFS